MTLVLRQQSGKRVAGPAIGAADQDRGHRIGELAVAGQHHRFAGIEIIAVGPAFPIDIVHKCGLGAMRSLLIGLAGPMDRH